MLKRVAGIAVVLCAGIGLAAADFPKPVGKVNDFARVLKGPQRAALEALLQDAERDTTAEIAVVTIRDLEGESVEGYANGLFNAWGIGKQEKDNGVLILVARDSREMRIEVGYGLEGVLPDGLAGQVIRETFVPRFRDGDYATGILEGTERVVAIVRRNETVTVEQQQTMAAAAEEASRSWGVAAILMVMAGVGAFVLGTAVGAKTIGQTTFGLFITGVALFLTILGAPERALGIVVLLVAAIVLLGMRLGRRPKWRKSIRGTGKAAGGSGWVMGESGGSGGGSRSSGGGSSGSSSFGGGSSGGGGASGRW
jgi:uncharacterized protein